VAGPELLQVTSSRASYSLRLSFLLKTKLKNYLKDTRWSLPFESSREAIDCTYVSKIC